MQQLLPSRSIPFGPSLRWDTALCELLLWTSTVFLKMLYAGMHLYCNTVNWVGRGEREQQSAFLLIPEHAHIVKLLLPYCQYVEQGEPQELLWTLVELYAAVYLPARDGLTFLWGQGWRVYIYVPKKISISKVVSYTKNLLWSLCTWDKRAKKGASSWLGRGSLCCALGQNQSIISWSRWNYAGLEA